MTWMILVFLAMPTPETDVFTAPVKADEPALAAIAERMRATPVLRADFKQRKKITALRRPLRSNGLFVFAAEKGVYWRTDAPFKNVFIMTPDAIMQKPEFGDPITIKAEERPIISGFTRIFLALFQGDARELERRFELYFTSADNQWTIGLRPKSDLMTRLIDRIVLHGDDVMRRIEFFESNGDKTEIRFETVHLEPTELTDEERGWFEL